MSKDLPADSNELFKCAQKLADLLGDAHGDLYLLLKILATKQVSPKERKLIKEAQERLNKDQAWFLAEFGDWDQPGKN